MKTIAINHWPSLTSPRSNHDYFFFFFWTLPLVVSISVVRHKNRKLFCNFIWCWDTCLAYITRKIIDKYSPVVDCCFCFSHCKLEVRQSQAVFKGRLISVSRPAIWLKSESERETDRMRIMKFRFFVWAKQQDIWSCYFLDKMNMMIGTHWNTNLKINIDS